jgi:malonyl-CoA O-methyltransferase
MSKRFDRASETYDAHTDVQREVLAKIAAYIPQYLSPRCTLIDAGCGTGALASALKHYDVIQVDNSEAMCRAAALRHPQHRTIIADARHIPLPDRVVGGYVSSLCWQWVQPVQVAISEMRRVLAPMGYGIIATLCEGTFCELAESLHALNLPKRMLSCLPLDEISTALCASGAIIVTHHSETLIRHYPDVRAFFTQLRGIGATASHVSARPLTRSELIRLIAYYEAYFQGTEGISVTYQVGYWVVQYE